MQLINSLEKTLCRYFNASIKVIPCFKFDESHNEVVENCKNYFASHFKQIKTLRFLLEGSEFEIQGNVYDLLKTTCNMILQSGQCDKHLQDYIKTHFDRDITVEFVDPSMDEKQKNNL